MSSKPPAVVRPRMVPVTIISNDGASSSRDCGTTRAQEIAEFSPPQCSSTLTDSEKDTTPTSTSSLYSDHDEPSACQVLAPNATSTLAHKPRSMSASHLAPVPKLPQRYVPSACTRAKSLEPNARPTRMSSLRLSLASFVSRLFTRRKKGRHQPALSKVREDDRKEFERLNRMSARMTSLPLM